MYVLVSRGVPMQTKLTLRLDEALIKRAKIYAKHAGKPVSQLVAEYFAVLGTRIEDVDFTLTRTVRQLKGALRGADVDVSDYRRYLEEKYR
jgi:Family of unknown function (DUF6364)